MKLTIFNGSPKKEKSNTAELLRSFIKGISEDDDSVVEIHYLYGAFPFLEAKKAFSKSEYVLIAFPLYMASMPGCVKEFIEVLDETNRPNNGHIGYFVQFAFPEAVHARPLERYLEKLSFRLKRNYMGTIIMGRCEGINKKTAYFNKKAFKGMYLLGKTFANCDYKFNRDLIRHYAKPEKFSLFLNPIMKKIIVFYLNKFHWDALLRKNKILL